MSIKNKNQIAITSFSHIFFIIFSILCILPFVLLISISLSKEADIVKYGYSFIPKNIDFLAYKIVFLNPQQLIDSYKVTIMSTLVGTFFSLLVMSLVAYALSRTDFKYRKVVTFYLFFTMLFNGGLVPSYILISQYLKLTDTFWVLVIPGLVNVWYIILLRTFFQSIPPSIFESAKIDGASEFTIFFKIVIHLSKPALATIALFGVLIRWNDWFTALLYIKNEKLLTLQYLLQRIILEMQLLNDANQNLPQELLINTQIPTESLRMAMVILVAGPMLVVFPFFQKYFVKGLTVGSVKG